MLFFIANNGSQPWINLILQNFTRLYCLALSSARINQDPIFLIQQNVYIYIYIYTDTYIYISTYNYIYIHIYIYIFVDHSMWKISEAQLPSHQVLGWFQGHGQTAEATSGQKDVRLAQGFHSSQMPGHGPLAIQNL